MGLGLGESLWARSAAEDLERGLAAERHYALRQAEEGGAFAERAKSAAKERTAVLEAESAAAKDEVAGLQKDLLALLTKDDPGAIKALRVRLAARQAALAAVEGDKALLLKETEEVERDQEMWKKRAATLDLALRMDMKTMLAGPADIEDREKRVDAALKDIDYQAGQIRKYASRRANAVAEATDLGKLRGETTAASEEADTPELRRALDEHGRQLQRQIGQQRQWVLLNKQLEDRSRRNLAFARTEYLVSRRYADALAQKAALRRAADALAVAEATDAELAALRAALAPAQKRMAAELSAAAAANDQALKTLGEARTAQDQARGRGAYAAAQALKTRWEAESEFWKEFAALQKAGAAFARELADRARGLAEDRSIFDINQEERQLRESLGTSEQYVRSLDLMVQKADGLIESDRRELRLPPEAVAAMAQPLTDLFGNYDAAHPPAPDLVADQLKTLLARLAEQAPGEGEAAARRQVVSATLVARLGQREMLRARKAISERWLENSRTAIRNLERLAGTVLWQQHDPRLNGMACLEAGDLFGRAVSDASFAWDGLRLDLTGAPGVPGRKGLMEACALVLLLGVAGWGVGRLIPPLCGWRWLAGRLATVLPALLAAAWAALRVGSGNLAFRGAGWILAGLAAWCAIRYLMLSLAPDRRSPPGATLGGGVYAAVLALAAWTALLIPLHRLAPLGANAWDVQAVLERVWLFGICLALFRLALHPTLLGRVLSRRSENRGLRWLGASVAVACTAAAALAALPYLAGLDNLGGTVLHTVEASFVVLAGALIGTTAAGWAIRRRAEKVGARMAWVRTAQSGVILVAGAGAAWMWWQLLNRVVLAPNAPPLVQDSVQAVKQVMRTAVLIWRKELTPGMTVSSLSRGLLVFMLSFWVSKVVKRQFLDRALARTPMDETTRLTFATILGYVIILMGFLVGLNVAGSSLQNLALLAGAITVGLGFGLQNVINNFVSSLLIHFGRTIRVGDYIEVGGTRGTVREIGLRNTMIATDDGITVLVPNGSFVSANIVNWTNPTRRVRLHIPLALARQADLTAATELAIATAKDHPAVSKEPAPLVEVRSVTAAQTSLELLAWTEKPERLATIMGELNLSLDRALREKGFVA
jgi:small-conductance mechanosensitive channel